VETPETSSIPPGLAQKDGGVGSLSDRRIGSVVDKYTIVSLLGRGGMGAVYEARHKLSRRFAIKFLHHELAANREILHRFENEARAAGGLEHPNLAAVIDWGRSADGAPYIVMEFLEGEDCSSLLKRLGPLPPTRAADIVFQACRGLAVAHRAGIIHRDLKPANLFLCDAGDGSDLVKVLDFGIAKLRTFDRSFVTGMGATLGTPYYMSPEQAGGAGEVDKRTDVWSLGVVLYELLSGQKPFTGNHFVQGMHEILNTEAPRLSTVRRGLPAGLVAVVHRAMEKDLEKRYQTVAALAEALGPFAGRESSVRIRRATPRLPTVDALLESGRSLGATSSRTVAMVSVGAGLVFAAAIAAAVWTGRAATRAQPAKVAASPAARLAPASASGGSDDDLARTYLEVAESLSKEKRFELAMEVLDASSSLKIKSAELNIRGARLSDGILVAGLLKKATSRLQDKDWQGAVDASKAALDRDSENAEALRILNTARTGLQPATVERGAKGRERGLAGTLTIKTTPVAMVYVDDEPIGRSPITHHAIGAGDHTVQARAQGYQPATSSIEVPSGRPVALVFRLAASSAGGQGAGSDEGATGFRALPTESPRGVTSETQASASASAPTPAIATPKASPPPPTSIAAPVASTTTSAPAAGAPQIRSSRPVVSVMPRSPVPRPTLPRDRFAENGEEVSRVCQLVEEAAVSLGGVSPEFARGITGPLRRSLGGGGEMYGVAMYYFIIREASLQHDSKTAAESLAAAQSKGLLLRLKDLPGNDRDL
jgi:serine/threonine protein kinase